VNATKASVLSVFCIKKTPLGLQGLIRQPLPSVLHNFAIESGFDKNKQRQEILD